MRPRAVLETDPESRHFFWFSWRQRAPITLFSYLIVVIIEARSGRARAMIWVVLLWAQSAAQQQVQRGEALFLEASKGCVNCHALKGHGTAAGPDLSIIGRLSPQAIVTAVRSSATQYVQGVKLKSGESFPGMPAGQDEKMLQFYDVSKMPPELRKIERTDLESAANQDQWKHPPSLGGYTNQQLADIIAYIRASVTGTAKSVSAAEIE